MTEVILHEGQRHFVEDKWESDCGTVKLYRDDCRRVLPALGSVDAVCADPPYGLEFMGKEWDRLWNAEPYEQEGYQGNGGLKRWTKPRPQYVADLPAQHWHQQWASALLPAVKPGGYLLAFGGTRTFHRLTCALEDAGWEIRDTLMWVYGSGFPKGRGCLKPAWEPVTLARKPGPRVLPLQIDECRVPAPDGLTPGGYKFSRRGDIYAQDEWTQNNEKFLKRSEEHPAGRYPANLIHDGSEEVLEVFARAGERRSPRSYTRSTEPRTSGYNGIPQGDGTNYGDSGTAARFFYCAKASRKERGEGNDHPTVKPLKLVEHLVRLICPEGGTVIDPFMGSGTTGVACVRTGRRFIGIEREPEHFETARKRIQEALAGQKGDLFPGEK